MRGFLGIDEHHRFLVLFLNEANKDSSTGHFSGIDGEHPMARNKPHDHRITTGDDNIGEGKATARLLGVITVMGCESSARHPLSLLDAKEIADGMCRNIKSLGKGSVRPDEQEALRESALLR